jgi:serine/threonine-protein kinase
MRFVHSRKIIHGDLKPSNILLDGERQAWIADFGASRWVSADWTPTESETGTVRYAAPELFEEDGNRTTGSDIFSFGSIVYEMLVGRPVFDGTESAFAVLKRLRNGDLPRIPATYGRLVENLISQCWQKDQASRPSFAYIFLLFSTCDFNIIPGVDASAIRRFCDSILGWEERLSAASSRRANEQASSVSPNMDRG